MQYLVDFIIKDKRWVSAYCPERKKIYFTAPGEKEVEDYIKEKSIDGNGAFSYTIIPCNGKDLTGIYYTDGFQSLVIPKDDVIGKIDINKREWLVRWELREHSGEYAKVIRKETFIVDATNADDAGRKADYYAIAHRYSHLDDYSFYTITGDEGEIALAKEGNFVRVN